MMSRVREALFSMLYPSGVLRPSARHLDLFAGSGVVGLESLSRGVGHASFVDFSSKCTGAIRKNAEVLGYGESVHVVEAKVDAFLATPERFGVTQPFDLVAITPPYEEVVYAELMEQVSTPPHRPPWERDGVSPRRPTAPLPPPLPAPSRSEMIELIDGQHRRWGGAETGRVAAPSQFPRPRPVPFGPPHLTTVAQQLGPPRMLRAQCASSAVLGEDSLVVVEYPIELGCFPPTLADGRLIGLRNRKYGRTVIAIYVNRPSGRLDMSPWSEEFVAL